MLVTPISLETAAAKRADLVVELTYKDFAAGVTNTALVLNLFTQLANVHGVELAHAELVQPFQDSDAAFVSSAITVGDAGSAARHLASMEMNARGTYVPLKFGTGTKYTNTADTVVTATITPTAAKNLATLTQGKVLLYFRVIDARQAA